MGNADPDTWLGTFLSCDAIKGSNYTKWCYKPFNDLIIKAKMSPQQAKRIKLYQQAQRIVKEQLPMTVLAHATVYQPLQKKVVGFKILLFGTNAFYGVGLQ
jgi:dipeptide transport system substrate-binding protein